MGSPLERDARLCEYLGKVTARWGMMEEALCVLLSNLLQDKELGRSIYFSAGSFRQRIETIKSVVRAKIFDDAELKHISDLLSKIYKTFQVRNKLTHAHYVLVVKDKQGELSYLNSYFDDDISLAKDELTPLYVGRLDNKSDSGVVRVNAGTFSNHGEKVTELMHQVLDWGDLY